MNEIFRYCEILGVEVNASLPEIKRAYRDLVKVWHPDRFQHEPRLQLKAQEHLKEINEAYEGLCAFIKLMQNQPIIEEEPFNFNEEKDHFEEEFKPDESQGSNQPPFKSIRLSGLNLKPLAAFIAFNIYFIFLISSFMENTSYLFDTKTISKLNKLSIPIDPREWGWAGHYIWCLFSSSVVTALSSIICGAIAKNKGGKIALISNIPNTLVWGLFFYIAVFTKKEFEGRNGFIFAAIIAIPLTYCIAYLTGNFAEKFQNEEFQKDTVLGIRPYHWVWLIFPLYWYGLGIVYSGSIYASFFVMSEISIYNNVIGLILLLPVIAWFYPLNLVYKILRGVLLSEKSNFKKITANIAILLIGIFLASGLQYGCYWVFKKLL